VGGRVTRCTRFVCPVWNRDLRGMKEEWKAVGKSDFPWQSVIHDAFTGGSAV